MRKWVNEGWSLRYIFNYALALHGSYINNKSAPLPEGPNVRPELERFLRRLGYRLVLCELRHEQTGRAGKPFALEMKWQNTGSAPCYRPYRLVYRLTDQQGRARILIGKVTVNHWMPGSVDVFTDDFLREPPDLPPGRINDETDTIVLPNDLRPGHCQLAIGVVAQGSEQPIVQLGIEGRDQEGWYPVSDLQIEK